MTSNGSLGHVGTVTLPNHVLYSVHILSLVTDNRGERSGSMVECLSRDQEAAGSRLTGITALWSLSKTHLS